MNASRGPLRFIADGRESFQAPSDRALFVTPR